MASDYTTDLIDGAALLLVQAALGVYRTDGTPYTAADTAVVVASMPDGPDRAICLTPYDVEDNDLSDAVTGLQIRMRTGTDPRALMTLADGVRDLFHNRRGFWLGGVYVALCWRQSQAPMGADVHGRQELAANYYLRTTRPSPNLYE